MDAILEHTLNLACELRDSNEAAEWRTAWGKLASMEPDLTITVTTPPEDIPVTEFLRSLCISDQAICRPLMFPLLLPPDLRIQLKEAPDVLGAYRVIHQGFAVIGMLVTALRSVAPGFPHEGIVHTLPSTPLDDLSVGKELPWGLSRWYVTDDSAESHLNSTLRKNLPSRADKVLAQLRALTEAIRASEVWEILQQKSKAVQSRGNLVSEMERAVAEFEKKLAALRRTDHQRRALRSSAEDLALAVYAKRGPRIQGYVEAFKEYECLVERIYWMISHLSMYEQISCLSSSVPHEMQQVSLSGGRDTFLSALAPTVARSLIVGQLVHVQLPETGHTLDGLFRIEQWLQQHKAGVGASVLFLSRRIWKCGLDDVRRATDGYQKQTFVPSQAKDPIKGSFVRIALPGKPRDFPIEEMAFSELLRNTHIPH